METSPLELRVLHNEPTWSDLQSSCKLTLNAFWAFIARRMTSTPQGLVLHTDTEHSSKN